MSGIIDRPNTIPWPPIIFIATIAAAVGLQLGIPLTYSPHLPLAAFWIVGGAFMAFGLALDLGAMLAMRKHRTNILPNRAADRLLTTSVFSLSRNPIYTGNVLLIIGAAMAFANPWLILAALVSAIAVHFLAIKREERHLAHKFGVAWRDYSAATPRWLII